MPYRVLLLGGYGFFGSRIAERLAQDARYTLLIAGRDARRCESFAEGLRARHCAAQIEAWPLDLAAENFENRLRDSAPQLLVHSADPFQQRDYRVARACIAAGLHYLDLADSRAFVCGIGELDTAARQAGLCVLSGASTVPAVSAAVIDEGLGALSHLEHIDIGVSPGNRTERGLATVAAILSYCGQPLSLWRSGGWRRVHGWQGLQRRRYAGLGSRWLSYCEVPDLELLPARHPGVRSVQFRAGLELGLLHLGLWGLSWLVRARLVRNLAPHAARLKSISEWFRLCGSDAGAMHLTLRGMDRRGRPLTRNWELIAGSGDGPQIPCSPAVVLAAKLADGELRFRGARPCMGLLGLDELRQAWRSYDIRDGWRDPL